MRIQITGEGNFDIVTAPYVDAGPDFKTYEPQVQQKGAGKVYEQILIPRSADVKEIPSVSFSFFDPRTGGYRTLEKGPFPLTVEKSAGEDRKSKIVSMPAPSEGVFFPREELGEDIVHIKDYPGALLAGPRVLLKVWWYWALNLGMMLFFILFYTVHRKRERIRTDASYAKFLKAPRAARKTLARARKLLEKGDVPGFYDMIFKTMQNYLTGRFKIPRGSVTPDLIRERMRSANCPESTLKTLDDIFSRCEMARYASVSTGENEAIDLILKVRKVMDELEKFR